MMPHLMNCAHDPEGWCLDCVKELAESTLPAAAVRDALAELRTEFERRTGQGASIPWRAAFDLAVSDLKATMTALGLKPTREQKRADLARAMGWKLEQDGYWQQWRSADGKTFCSVRPSCDESPIGNPYESADDKDALVAWLAADDARWDVFIRKFIKLINWPSQSPQEMTDATFPKIVNEVKHLMTAPREIIADAAWLAIQIDASPPPA